jgi:hypothetical protein
VSGDGEKRALLVSPAFFGYENAIVDELRRQGYSVDFLDERPSNRAVERAVLRFNKGLVAGRVRNYYRSAAQRLSGRPISLILVIKAEVVPRWFLEDLRRDNPECEFVFYAYDSIRNSPNCLDVLDCFDRRLSFDRTDVAEFDDFEYEPLFYTREFERERVLASRRYDLAFVGTLHSERSKVVRNLMSGADAPFTFLYVQARWFFALNKYVFRTFADVRWAEVSFSSLSRGEVAGLFADSKAVLDIPRSGQSGLTMRTFEVLAAGAILLTTNRSVMREPFYDPNWIIVIDEHISADHLEKIWRDIRSLAEPDGRVAGIERFSLASWVGRITATREDVLPKT